MAGRGFVGRKEYKFLKADLYLTGIPVIDQDNDNVSSLLGARSSKKRAPFSARRKRIRSRETARSQRTFLREFNVLARLETRSKWRNNEGRRNNGALSTGEGREQKGGGEKKTMYETKSEARNENSRDRAYGTCYCYGSWCMYRGSSRCLVVCFSHGKERQEHREMQWYYPISKTLMIIYGELSSSSLC